MNYTHDEILQRFNCPPIVEHDGKWWEPDRIDTVQTGDVYWCGGRISTSYTAREYSVIVSLILRPANVPPRPTDEWLKANTPAGKVARLGDRPVTGNYRGWVVGWNGKINKRLWEVSAFDLREWRWPVTLEDAPKVEEVKPMAASTPDPWVNAVDYPVSAIEQLQRRVERLEKAIVDSQQCVVGRKVGG